MKIESVRVEGLRSIDNAEIALHDYTCLVGPNGAGKSNILFALNVFFREKAGCPTDVTSLIDEDFHDKDTQRPVTITVTFGDLSAAAERDFADYVRQGKLVVSAVAEFDSASGEGKVGQYGQRLGMPAFKEYFKALGDKDKVDVLRARYNEITSAVADLPAATTQPAMTRALRDYEATRPERCELIPSEDEFYGVSRGKNLLEKYVQWVCVPAVKDAASEQIEARDTALGKLLVRAVDAKANLQESVDALRKGTREEYQQLLDAKQGLLEETSKSLAQRLADWSHPDASVRLEWREDLESSVRVADPLAQIVAGEGGFEGELPRFGHGLQRCYLLALLEEINASDDPGAPTLILACEDPELYQHPPQARHLSNVLQKLSTVNSQVLVCTHSPYFVSGRWFEDVRMVRKEDGHTAISAATFEEVRQEVAAATGDPPVQVPAVLARIHRALQPSLNEMFFTPRPIFVEGIEDVAYIATYLHRMGDWDEYRRCGCHMIPTDRKHWMIQPLAIARRLSMPFYVVFDSDADESNETRRREHERDNTAILRLCGVPAPEPFPDDTFWGERVVAWRSDIGSVVAGDIGDEWQAYQRRADEEYGHAGDLHKNPLHIAAALSRAWDDGRKSESLQRLCRELVAFGKSAAAVQDLRAPRRR